MTTGLLAAGLVARGLPAALLEREGCTSTDRWLPTLLAPAVSWLSPLQLLPRELAEGQRRMRAPPSASRMGRPWWAGCCSWLGCWPLRCWRLGLPTTCQSGLPGRSLSP